MTKHTDEKKKAITNDIIELLKRENIDMVNDGFDVLGPAVSLLICSMTDTSAKDMITKAEEFGRILRDVVEMDVTKGAMH